MLILTFAKLPAYIILNSYSGKIQLIEYQIVFHFTDDDFVNNHFKSLLNSSWLL
jgi:hypothetical protein